MPAKNSIFVVAAVSAVALIVAVMASRSGGSRAEAPAEEISSGAEVLPVFRESVYSIKAPRMMVLTTNRDAPVLSSGSGFLLQVGGEFFVVTAGHVATGAPRLDALTVDGTRFVTTPDGATQIIKSSDRVRLGYKSLVPARALHRLPTDPSIDISVFTVENPEWLGVRPLKPGTIEKGSRIVTLGFPALPEASIATNSTAATGPVSNAARREQTVTSLEGGYFVTEGSAEVSSGFSGGPVLNDQGDVVGLAVRASGSQTRCMYIQQVIDLITEFGRESFAYVE